MLICESSETYRASNCFEMSSFTRQNVFPVSPKEQLVIAEPRFDNKNIDFSLLSLINNITEQAEYCLTGNELKQIFICYNMGLYDNIWMVLNSVVNTTIKETYHRDGALMKNKSSENHSNILSERDKHVNISGKSNMHNEILSELEQLNIGKQKKVLDFIHSLNDGAPRGAAGKELLKFAGILTPEEGKELLKIIDKDCGEIDFSEW